MGFIKSFWLPTYYSNLTQIIENTLDDYSYSLRLEAENASRHVVTANGNAQLDGSGRLILDGDSDVTVSDNGDWNTGTDPFTYEIVFKLDNLTGDQILLSKYQSGDGSFFLHTTGDKISAWVVRAGFGAINMPNGTTSIVADTWYHAALQFDGTDMKIYLAQLGQQFTLESTQALGGSLDVSVALFTVGYAQGQGVRMTGTVEAVRCSIGIERYSTSDIGTNNLVVDESTGLALNFDGSAASTRIIDSAKPDHGGIVGFCPDVSGNENDGNPTDVLYDAITPAYIFNGSSSKITCGANVLSNTPFSIYSVFNASGYGGNGNGRIIGKNNSGNGYDIQIRNDAELEVYSEFVTTDGYWETNDDSIQLNTDYVASVVYDRTDNSDDPVMRLNGVTSTQTESSTPAGANKDDSSDAFIIGNVASNTRGFDGKISEILGVAEKHSDTDRNNIEQLLITKYGI